MTKIVVSKFSCIEQATLKLGPLTVLIGPQASGKSILCKLNYFFIDILQQQPNSASDGMSFDAYKDKIKEKFIEWFPLTAWGTALFVIEFQAGDCEIRFSRTSYRGVPSDNFRIWVSEGFKAHYASLMKLRQNILNKSRHVDDDADFSLFMGLHEASQKSLRKLLGDDYLSSQIFVPAGRSFFTSIGKALSAFEHGKTLDPLIMNFGRLYARYRDRSYRTYPRHRYAGLSSIMSSLNEIFGGELKAKGDDEYVLCKDGRRIPFSALSSGQQELLPLITVLPRLIRQGGVENRHLAYIEEPEAHLFPGAQSKLIAALASIVNHSEQTVKMVLTTHSPYVLAKFNNLIKAGQISSIGKKEKEAVEKIIPTSFQMPKGFVNAYAIIDKKLECIMDDDGLIAADYLDDVSGEISNEFSQLLAVEFSL